MCTICATQPVKPVRAARSASVTTRRVAPTADVGTGDTAGTTAAGTGTAGTVAAGTGAATRSAGSVATPRQGVIGRGDPEVRGRRARNRALQELSELHADDFERLLLDARKAEGLM